MVKINGGKKRVGYIDIAKGIGIILVVLGHTNSPLRNYIYQFHMPLFFFLSGTVYKDKEEKGFINLAMGKIRSLYIPYLAYGLSFLALHNVFYKLNIYSKASNFMGKVQEQYKIKDFMRQFFNTLTCSCREQVGGAMWFLSSLLIVSMLFIIIRRLLKKVEKRELYVMASVVVLFIVGYYTNLPRYFSISLVALFFYYLGYLYKVFKEKIKLNFYVFIISVLSIIALAPVNKVDMVINKYTNPLLLILSSLLGIYMILYLSKLIEDTSLNKKISYIGRNTMVIMTLHFLAFKTVNLIEVVVYGEEYELIGSFPVLNSTGVWWIVYGVVGVFLPLIGKWFLLKLRKDVIKNKEKSLTSNFGEGRY
ncbi:MAG: hypothetical protein E7214_02920 [Clostridium sp.]|nr:hypothetical protein [Clostridium sp.]